MTLALLYRQQNLGKSYQVSPTATSGGISAILNALFNSASYAENGTSYPIGSLPGFSFANSTGGTSLDGTASFAANTPRISSGLGLLVETAATNLCPYSQTFGSWAGNAGWTVTAGQTDPAGGTTAHQFVCNAGSAYGAYYYSQAVTYPAGNVTVSVWAKTLSGTAKFCFDVSLDDDNYSPDYTATTTWQRFNWTFNCGGGDDGDFEFSQASDGSAASIIFAFAQVEAGNNATSYIPTPSGYAASASRAADVVTHTFTGSGPVTITTPGLGGMTYPVVGVTNLIPYSNAFDVGHWNGSAGLTYGSTQVLAPDGSNTASNISWSAGTVGAAFLCIPGSGGIILAPSTTYTLSFWVQGSGNFMMGWNDDTTPFASATSSLIAATGTWTRKSFTFTTPSSITTTTSNITIIESGDTAAGNVNVWGAQLETGSTANGYVPTNGFTNKFVPSSPLNLAGSQVINQCLYSNSLNTGWSALANGSIASGAGGNATSPDGFAGAWAYSAGTTNGYSCWQSNVMTTAASTTYTASAYFKYSNVQYVRLEIASSSDSFGANFDILNGVAGARNTAGSGTVISSSITAVGFGWYRCTVTGSLTFTNANFRFLLVNSNSATGGGYVGASTDNALIFGPQCELGSVASNYYPSDSSGDVGLAPFVPWMNQYIQSVYIAGTVSSGGNGSQMPPATASQSSKLSRLTGLKIRGSFIAPTIDNTSEYINPGTIQTGSSSWSFTIGASANLLMVFIQTVARTGTNPSQPYPANVACNSVALTLQGTVVTDGHPGAGADRYVQLWTLQNPPTGSVTITWNDTSGTNDQCTSAMNVSIIGAGPNPITNIDTASTNSGTSISITDTFPVNTLVFTAWSDRSTAISSISASGFTSIGNGLSGTNGSYGGGYQTGNGLSITNTVSMSTSADVMSMMMCAVNGGQSSQYSAVQTSSVTPTYMHGSSNNYSQPLYATANQASILLKAIGTHLYNNASTTKILQNGISKGISYSAAQVSVLSPIKSFYRTLTATASQISSYVKQFGHVVTYSVNTTKNLQNGITKGISNVASQVSIVTKQYSHIYTATASQVSTSQAIKVFVRNFTATASQASNLSKQVGKILYVVNAQASQMVKAYTHTFVATASQLSVSTAIKVFIRNMNATGSQVSTLTKPLTKTLVATASQASVMTKNFGHLVYTLASQASTVIKAISSKMPYATASQASNTVASKTFFRTLTATGAQVSTFAKLFGKNLNTTASQASKIANAITKYVPYSANTVKNLSNAITKTITGQATQTSVATNSKVKIVNLSATGSQISTVLKVIAKTMPYSFAQASTVLKGMGKIIQLTSNQTSKIGNAISKFVPYNVVQTSISQQSRAYMRTLTATASQVSININAITKKVQAATASQVSTVAQIHAKILIVTANQISIFVHGSNHFLTLLATATQVSLATPKRAIGNVLQATANQVSVLYKSPGKFLYTIGNTSSTLSKTINKLLPYSAAQNSSLFKALGRTLAAIGSQVSTLYKSSVKILVATGNQVSVIVRSVTHRVYLFVQAPSNVFKGTNKTLTATGTQASTLFKTQQKLIPYSVTQISVATKAFGKTLSSTATQVSIIRNNILKLVYQYVQQVSNLIKVVGTTKVATASQTSTVTPTKFAPRLLSATANQVSTLTKNFGHVFAATASQVSVLNKQLGHTINLVVTSPAMLRKTYATVYKATATQVSQVFRAYPKTFTAVASQLSILIPTWIQAYKSRINEVQLYGTRQTIQMTGIPRVTQMYGVRQISSFSGEPSQDNNPI